MFIFGDSIYTKFSLDAILCLRYIQSSSVFLNILIKQYFTTFKVGSFIINEHTSPFIQINLEYRIYTYTAPRKTLFDYKTVSLFKIITSHRNSKAITSQILFFNHDVEAITYCWTWWFEEVPTIVTFCISFVSEHHILLGLFSRNGRIFDDNTLLQTGWWRYVFTCKNKI